MIHGVNSSRRTSKSRRSRRNSGSSSSSSHTSSMLMTTMMIKIPMTILMAMMLRTVDIAVVVAAARTATIRFWSRYRMDPGKPQLPPRRGMEMEAQALHLHPGYVGFQTRGVWGLSWRSRCSSPD